MSREGYWPETPPSAPITDPDELRIRLINEAVAAGEVRLRIGGKINLNLYLVLRDGREVPAFQAPTASLAALIVDRVNA